MVCCSQLSTAGLSFDQLCSSAVQLSCTSRLQVEAAFKQHLRQFQEQSGYGMLLLLLSLLHTHGIRCSLLLSCSAAAGAATQASVIVPVPQNLNDIACDKQSSVLPFGIYYVGTMQCQERYWCLLRIDVYLLQSDVHQAFTLRCSPSKADQAGHGVPSLFLKRPQPTTHTSVPSPPFPPPLKPIQIVDQGR